MRQPKKYKTLEVAQHEIEIQAALERIRAKALAMVKTEDIQSVAAETRAVLEVLGIPARGTAIYVFDKKADTLDYYGSKNGHERTRLSEGGYGFKPRSGRKRWTMNKVNNAQEQRKATGGIRGPLKFPVFTYRFYFTGGQLRITAEREFDRAELAFARRVTETFTLAYKRFLELQQKEAQNRELMIQNALEKVRAQALGMQESGEIRDVTRAMFDAFNDLGLELTRHHITLVDEDKNLWQPWVTAKVNDTWDVEMNTSLDQAIARFPELEQVLEARRLGKSHYTFQRTAEEERDAVRHGLALKSRPLSTSAEDMLCRLFTFFSAGWCLLFSRQPLSEDQIAIVGRIVGVFDYAYSRFLELKEKEQRARNAEIEAALERVRAHALGMQESGDIMGVATALRNGFEDLGYDLDQALIRIPDVSNKVMKQWIANPLVSRDTAFREGREGSLDRRRAWVKKWEQNQKYWAEQVDRDQRASRIRASLTASGVSPADVKARIKAMPEPYFDNCLNFGAGLIVFGCAYAFSEEDFEIAGRFADVFGIAYRRFRELQEKEEQNRELTIQNALERVRARALGMQASQDISLVGKALVEEIRGLTETRLCWIVLLDRDSPAVTETYRARPRLRDGETGFETSFSKIYLERIPEGRFRQTFEATYNAWKNGDSIYVYEVINKEVHDFTLHGMLGRGNSLTVAREQARRRRRSARGASSFRHCIFHTHGYFNFEATHHLSEEEIVVGKRFTEVFDHAYARFLELKQKEEQNRELTIQNALERVRARALGMQVSEEISGVATTLLDEFTNFGYDILNFRVYVHDKGRDMLTMYQTSAFARDVMEWPDSVLMSRKGWETPLSQLSDWERTILAVKASGASYHIRSIPHKESWQEALEWRAEDLGKGQDWVDQKMKIVLARAPEICQAHSVFFDFGYLEIHYPEKLSEEVLQLASRFGEVFGFAHERFKELQEKEAQNRELTIQNALERVRARALGMQESTELGEVVWDLFEETQGLGFDIEEARMLIMKPDEDSGVVWWAARYFDRSHGSNHYRWNDINEREWFQPVMAAWKRGERWHIEEDVETQESYDVVKSDRWTVLEDHGVDRAEIERRLKHLPLPGQMRYLNHIFFAYGIMGFNTDARRYNEDELDVLARFTSAFEFAYKRFLELQAKEKQTREAEQRAAVDRVRAEATAMAATDDIANVVKALWQGLMGQLAFTTLVFRVEDEQAEELQMYVATADGSSGVQFPEENMMQRDLLMGVHLYRSTMLLDMMQADDEARRGIHTGIDEGVNKDVRTLWGFELPEDLIGRTQRLVVPFEFGQISVIREETPFAESDLACAEAFAEGVSLGFTRYFDFRRLEAQNVALEKANEEIQMASKLKSRFLATMSHELRTPMNAIIGFTRLVLRRSENLEERQQGNLEKVLHSSNHLLNLINDVLDLSKIEADRMDMKPETFQVKDLIVSSCSTVSPLVREGVVLIQDLADDLGEAHTDAARLRQVMINLLSNALKFTEEGEVTVTGRRSQVTGQKPVGSEGGEGLATDFLEIVVRDTGIGIPEDQLEIIFDEFRQVDGSSTRKVQGTGLGLSICKRLVELMGGTVGVASEVGKGSTFTVKIPATYKL